jgi:hypothetical protein
MDLSVDSSQYLTTYYCLYLGACALIVVFLGWVLHRTGRVFLNDALAGNATLVSAVSRLLDIGFYLVSLGYVGLFYHPMWLVNDLATALKLAITRTGGLLLVLGVAHVFNLLVLAILRARGSASHRASA